MYNIRYDKRRIIYACGITSDCTHDTKYSTVNTTKKFSNSETELEIDDKRYRPSLDIPSPSPPPTLIEIDKNHVFELVGTEEREWIKIKQRQ